ncbi:MAG: hypothetical protein IJU98_00740 [Synergistaceae bacterium]|nr:hypothetical protein [Synergistaceae bacterium]
MKKRIGQKSLCLLMLSTLLFFLPITAAASESVENPPRGDLLELRVPCRVGENVTAVLPNGEGVVLGKVLMVPVKTNWPAYTASKWCSPATVCASAVNAVHLLVDVKESRGRILSLVPAVTVAPAAAPGAFFSLDMPAGTGLFGGFAPLVGSSVSIAGQDGERPLDGAPKEGETLIIRSTLPERPDVYMVDIENRPGGRVIAWSGKGPSPIARVVRPVGGVGRFGGTQFQRGGRIRASHAGVIDVATAPRGEVGGIQIMPLRHALTSKEMANAWKLTQWMIVAPLPGNPPLEGTPPLFKNAFVPGTQMNDHLTDLWSDYGRRPLVLCRLSGGPWTRLPQVSGRVDDALLNLTHLRLYCPFWNPPIALDTRS